MINSWLYGRPVGGRGSSPDGLETNVAAVDPNRCACLTVPQENHARDGTGILKR